MARSRAARNGPREVVDMSAYLGNNNINWAVSPALRKQPAQQRSRRVSPQQQQQQQLRVSNDENSNPSGVRSKGKGPMVTLKVLPPSPETEGENANNSSANVSHTSPTASATVGSRASTTQRSPSSLSPSAAHHRSPRVIQQPQQHHHQQQQQQRRRSPPSNQQRSPLQPVSPQNQPTSRNTSTSTTHTTTNISSSNSNNRSTHSLVSHSQLRTPTPPKGGAIPFDLMSPISPLTPLHARGTPTNNNTNTSVSSTTLETSPLTVRKAVATDPAARRPPHALSPMQAEIQEQNELMYECDATSQWIQLFLGMIQEKEEHEGELSKEFSETQAALLAERQARAAAEDRAITAEAKYNECFKELCRLREAKDQESQLQTNVMTKRDSLHSQSLSRVEAEAAAAVAKAEGRAVRAEARADMLQQQLAALHEENRSMSADMSGDLDVSALSLEIEELHSLVEEVKSVSKTRSQTNDVLAKKQRAELQLAAANEELERVRATVALMERKYSVLAASIESAIGFSSHLADDLAELQADYEATLQAKLRAEDEARQARRAMAVSESALKNEVVALRESIRVLVGMRQ